MRASSVRSNAEPPGQVRAAPRRVVRVVAAESTAAMRKLSSEFRVVVTGPIISMGVVMTGSPLARPPCGVVRA